MPFFFGETSQANLVKVHPQLVRLLQFVLDLEVMDYSVVEGLRSLETQRGNVAAGRSQTMNSKHLMQDDGYAHAVDLYPHPINMQKVEEGDAREISRFGVLNGLMQASARLMPQLPGERNMRIRWGGDWDSDGKTLDQKLYDAMHFEAHFY